MQAIIEISNFCKEFTFYDPYNDGRVIKIDHIRDLINIVLSESDCLYKDNRICVLGVINDKLLSVE